VFGNVLLIAAVAGLISSCSTTGQPDPEKVGQWAAAVTVSRQPVHETCKRSVKSPPVPVDGSADESARYVSKLLDAYAELAEQTEECATWAKGQR